MTATVTREALERDLEALAASSDPLEGVFGVNSPFWMVGRESLLVLVGGRAALLQTAHPYVAQAIVDQSKVFTDIQRRFRNTLSLVYRLTFDSTERALETARVIYRVHERVTGEMQETVGRFPRGHRYAANEPEALMWVAATLFDTSFDIFERVIRPLRADERNAYYADARRFMRLFGVPDAVVPPDWAAFRRYFDAMIHSDTLGVGPAARHITRSILATPRPALAPAYGWIRIATAGLLPPPLRRAYELPWSRADEITFEASLRAMRATVPHLPDRVRFCPPYTNARRRLAGREGSDSVGRAMRRLALSIVGPGGRTAGQ